ncbi:MAG: prolyl oligopeptidase family serine peptidase [Haliangiales bacterium]
MGAALLSAAALCVAATGAAGCANKTTTRVPPSPVASGYERQIAPAPADQSTTEEIELVYPETLRQEVSDTIHGVEVADPYRWLEDGDNATVRDWMRRQDQLARKYLQTLPGRSALADRLRQLNYYDAVSPPEKRGQRYFYTRRHADKEKAILYWRSGRDGDETMLIDPNTLSDDGSVSLGGWSSSPDGQKLVYKLHQNAADAATMYVMDVDTRETSTVDVIDGAKYAYPAWEPSGEGFYYTRLPTDPEIAIADLPGHAHIRYHKLGEDPARDPEIFPATGDPRTFVSPQISLGGRYLVVSVAHGWNSTDVYFKDLRARRPSRRADANGFEPLAVGIEATFSVAEWKQRFYVLTNHDAPRYRMFSVDPERPQRRRWEELVPESTAVIERFTVIGDRLLLTLLENAQNRVEVRSLSGALERPLPLPDVGTVPYVVGNEDEDDAYFGFTSFVQPTQIYRASVSTGATELWSEIDIPIDASIFKVDQIWYPSADETRVSMFLIRRRDASPSGDVPTILYGYGGFNINLTPSFSANIVTWVEQGGMYAIPNLRGGGEYGEAWHKDGMLLAKQNTFDDFLAAARYLNAAGWTTPARLAISGGSNGGLLVGAAMTQEPAQFAAVICAVPLLDMVRYHRFGSGKTWISEYGSADDAEQFAVLHGYSPYHRVRKGVEYPAMLMLSADSDDRVDPMHARKFTAAVQWASSSDAPILLRVETNAGHGGADMVRQRIEQSVDTFAFLKRVLGVH